MAQILGKGMDSVEEPEEKMRKIKEHQKSGNLLMAEVLRNVQAAILDVTSFVRH